MIARRYFLILCAALLASACSSAVQNGALTGAEGGFRSAEISVSTRGSGPEVILIHGLAGHVDVWAPAAEALDDKYRLHLAALIGRRQLQLTTSPARAAAPPRR
jgi:pimeloyl-[acyl-carrier protein] methyl ester esterase